jgi:TRAP transporter TAXI family solute receptor
VPRDLTIATATTGGTYYPLGRQLAAALERRPGTPLRRAWACTTAGSNANLRLLQNSRRAREGEPTALEPKDGDWADLGLVGTSTLTRAYQANPRDLSGVRAITALQLDVVQVVVPSGVKGVEDLAGLRVYQGKEGSGTRWLASQVLASVLSDCPPAGRDLDFDGAAKALLAGELDAAVFAAGTPTQAVKQVVAEGFRILPVSRGDLDPDVFSPTTLPRGLYAGQDRDIPTVGTWTILCCRSDVDDHVVEWVLDTLHEEVDGLLLEHAKIQHLRLDQADAQRPDFLPLHPAAERFWRRERQTLRIATGSVGGRYFQIGKALQRLLARRGIPARAIHTQGSVHNVDLLLDGRPTLAILQYDVALAARWEDMKAVYGFEREREAVYSFPRAKKAVASHKGILALARLHDELTHILVRADDPRGGNESGLGPLKGRRISVGPPLSGSRLVAEALLQGAQILEEVDLYPISMPDTVHRLQSDELDALDRLDGAIFVGAAPSPMLRTVLADCRFRLLPVDGGAVADLAGRAFEVGRFEKGDYLCMGTEEPIPTIRVQAVLAANEDLPEETAEEVTRALVEGLGYVPGDLHRERLALPLPSLPFHPGAEAAYRDLGLLPSETVREALSAFLQILWYVLAILVILAAATQGALKLRRDAVANRFGRRVNRISVTSTEPHSVRLLRDMQTEVRERAARRWWQGGEIDRSRWHPLNEMIEGRIREARENLFRALVADVRALKGEPDLERRRKAALELRAHLWTQLQGGELDHDQLRSLRSMLEAVTAG